MTGKAIRTKLAKIAEKANGLVHRVAGIEVVCVPELDGTPKFFVMGEKMYNFDYAANTVYEMHRKSGIA